jgi:hypothetical protein
MAKTLAGVLAVSSAALLFAGCNSTGSGSASGTVPTTAMATTTTTPKFDYDTTECKRESSGIVTGAGWVRNDSSTEQSYKIEFEIADENRVRLARYDTGVGNVRAGQTARWQATSFTFHEGKIACRATIKPR